MADDIDRRALFQLGATIVAGAALPACRNTAEHHEEAPVTLPPSAGSAAVPAPTSFDLEEATLADLQAKMASHAETARSLVAKYRARIEALDRRGPKLGAVIELNPEADAIADQLDAERAAGKLRGPLHGIPILLKDNIDTGDKLTTTGGSLALEGSIAAKDAFAAARLRAAGAIFLGKANLSEWANFRGAPSTAGWSGRGGQCRNPYALDRTPSGSSSGSAVATSANLCAAAIGSETDGSVTSPASICGIVGIKPTVGLVSRAGVIPIAASQDTLGPLARTVTDVAILLTVMAGADPADAQATLPVSGRPSVAEDYTKALDPKALAGARLGVPRKGFFGGNRHQDAAMTAMLVELQKLGAVLVDPAELPAPPDLGAHELDVMCFELKTYLDRFLAARGGPVKSIADVIEFDRAHADREMRYFGQELLEQSAAKGTLTDKAYVTARNTCVAIARIACMDKVMAEHKLDAFVGSTRGPATVLDPLDGDDNGGTSVCQIPAIAGYPHVSVPGAWAFGMPIGLSFFGRPWSEGKLLGYAFAWEQATKRRKPPRFLPTVELG